MAQRIDEDSARFREIVRGKIKGQLKQYISNGELIGKKGRDLVSIPLPQISLPQFRYGNKQTGGVGQGPGDVGDPLGGDGSEKGKAGQGGGDHILEVDVSLEELAAMLGEELELPNIEPRGKKNITQEADKYTGIATVGPESLRHFKRTYKQALRRQVVAGEYDVKNPKIVPIREDTRYRSWNPVLLPEANAVVIYAMDVSGSMGDEQKELVRITSFWIDTWLRSQYKSVTQCYIIHDAKAREVDEHTFYHTREGGGTKISSAYSVMNQIIDERFPPSEWNIYGFHFSDGDNWEEDNNTCGDLLQNELLPKINQFCYGQVTSYWGSGQYLADLYDKFEDEEKVVTSEINDRNDILKAIKAFLGKGR
jgi:sporulation protein YhbH